MKENIQALKFVFGEEDVTVQAYTSNRKGTRYLLRGTKAKAARKDKSAYNAALEQAVLGVLKGSE